MLLSLEMALKTKSNLLQELLCNLVEKYNKIVFIIDNMHKSYAESIFQVFNQLQNVEKQSSFLLPREKQIDRNRPETTMTIRVTSRL